MYNYEMIADDKEELERVLYEEFIEEINWAFTEACEQ